MIKLVVDGDTLETSDGRRLQLIGVDAPETSACAGPAATAAAAQKVEGHQVLLYREAGRDRDKSGNLLVYVKYALGSYAGAELTEDLGVQLARDGWVKPYRQSGGNVAYMNEVTSKSADAKISHDGQFGPPCGPDWPASGGGGSGDGLSAPNLRDGALTGGFCSHRRWC